MFSSFVCTPNSSRKDDPENGVVEGETEGETEVEIEGDVERLDTQKRVMRQQVI
jgi:hypothetical protein